MTPKSHITSLAGKLSKTEIASFGSTVLTAGNSELLLVNNHLHIRATQGSRNSKSADTPHTHTPNSTWERG